MNDVAWEIEHSVETSAGLAFAWTYMTNVANWDDPPAEFELRGPFAEGSSGSTRMPGQETLHWQLRDIHPMECYTVEGRLGRATLWSVWRFDRVSTGGTRLTQRMVLKGEDAKLYVADVQAAFAPNLAPGMNRIAAAIGRAAAQADQGLNRGTTDERL
jgi:hypothetical protein